MRRTSRTGALLRHTNTKAPVRGLLCRPRRVLSAALRCLLLSRFLFLCHVCLCFKASHLRAYRARPHPAFAECCAPHYKLLSSMKRMRVHAMQKNISVWITSMSQRMRTSVKISISVFSFTSCAIRSASVRTSRARASCSVAMTKSCAGQMKAPPSRMPRTSVA